MTKTQKLIVSMLLLLLTSTVIASLFASAKPVRSMTNHIVISEIQVAGAAANDEFIELYNPTGSEVDLSSWSIQKENTSGAFERKNFVSTSKIPAHGYYLIAHADYANTNVPADMTQSTISMSATGTTVFLVSSQTTLSTGDEVSIIDRVAVGTSALDAETSPFDTIPAANDSIERKAGADSTSISMSNGDSALGNGYDSDNNSNDFVTRGTSDPQNSNSTQEPLEPTPTQPATPPVTGPTESPSPTPTDIPSPTPTEIPTPTETPVPTPTETSVPTVTPTIIPSPTLTPTPTPAQSRFTLGIIGFGKNTKVCTLGFRSIHAGFLRLLIPQLGCSKKS